MDARVSYGPADAVALEDSTPSRFDGRAVICLGFQLSNGMLVGRATCFADKSFDNARHQANEMADMNAPARSLRTHRLPLEEMEYIHHAAGYGKTTGQVRAS